MKNIDYYIKETNNGTIDGGNERAKAYSFIEDRVILVKKCEENFFELKYK